jgi:hypothetical protein
MISRTVINNLIDKVEKDYLECWQLLCKIKSPSPSSFIVEELLSFQPRLAEAIFQLSKMYRSLHQEKRNYIGKKNCLDKRWFVSRLKVIKKYQDAIATTIAIGKTLGDSFAWFFYHRELAHLAKHLKHQRIFHAPPGLGGRGEVEFIKQAQVLDGHLLIYHGITDILRFGDISLIDLKNFKLAAIGELKTAEFDKQKLNVSMTIISSSKKLTRVMEKLMRNSESLNQNSAIQSLPRNMQNRFHRQMREIDNSFDYSKPRAELSIETLSNAGVLEKLFAGGRKVACYKIGKSQILIRIPLVGKGLLKRIEVEPKVKFSNLNLIELTKQIMVERPDDNAFYIADIHSPSPNIRNVLGYMPLFWLPLSTEIVKELLFFKCKLISIYNPGPFISEIRQLGFVVQRSGKKYSVTRTLASNNILRFEGIGYFMGMIATQFMSEESVLEIFRRSILAADECVSGANVSARVQFNMLQCL